MLDLNNIDSYIEFYRKHYILNMYTTYEEKYSDLKKRIKYKNIKYIYLNIITQINYKCENKITNIDDIIFWWVFAHVYINDIYLLETLNYIYFLRTDKICRNNAFYYLLDNKSYNYKNKDKNILDYFYNVTLKKFIFKDYPKIIQINNKKEKLGKYNICKQLNNLGFDKLSYLKIVYKKIKEKFVIDYNNKYNKLFTKLVEKNHHFFVFENMKNIDSIAITEENLLKYKNEICNILKNNPITNKFKNSYYCFLTNILEYDHHQNFYSYIHNDTLEFNYFFNGRNIFIF